LDMYQITNDSIMAVVWAFPVKRFYRILKPSLYLNYTLTKLQK